MMPSDQQVSGLSRELIADTSRWRMVLEICPDVIGVLAYNPLAKSADGSNIVCRQIKSPGIDDIHAFEEVIYDNPFLLRDFARVDIIFRTAVSLVVPAEIPDTGAEHLLATAFPDASAHVVECGLLSQGAKVAYAVPHALHSFLSRTFYQATLHHPLAVLAAYFTQGGVRGNNPRLHINFSRPDVIDIIATRGSNLLLANSFRVSNADDAVYYLLAVRHTLGLDRNQATQILASGSGSLRKAVTNGLARLPGAPVMPVIFPTVLSALGIGSDMVAFEVAIMHLCE